MPRNKRKTKHLTIAQKVEILRKLERGDSANVLCQIYDIGMTTMYDIKNHKEELLAFYAERGSDKGLKKWKTMRTKCATLEKVLYQWFQQCHSEGATLTGVQIREKAKQFHKDLQISGPCRYSQGWLNRFKFRHGIYQNPRKSSVENISTETYISEFARLVDEEKLMPEQVYDAVETGLFWRSVPHQNLGGKDERGIPGGKYAASDRVTVLTCANAAGTHKCRLLLIGNSSCPLSVEGDKVLPLIYETDEDSCITEELFLEWFDNHFVAEAREHCRKAGLPENCKILLLLDKCSAHPDATRLVSGNVSATYLPQDCASIIQPMEQGVVRSMKTLYRKEFLRKLLESVPHDGIDSFVKKYTIKDCISAVAHAWDSVDKATLQQAWLKLWPLSVFSQTDADEDFEGFWPSTAGDDAAELLKYAQTISRETTNNYNEGNIMEWMICDVFCPVVSMMTDSKRVTEDCSDNSDEDISAVTSINNPKRVTRIKNTVQDCSDNSDEEDTVKSQKRRHISAGIKLADRFIEFLKQESCISKKEISTVYGIREKLFKQKQKQTTLEQSFAETRRYPLRRRKTSTESAGSLSDLDDSAYDPPPSSATSSPSAVPHRVVFKRNGVPSKTTASCHLPFHVVTPNMTKHDGARETCPICPPLLTVLVLDNS